MKIATKLTEADLQAFETQHNTLLPIFYRAFLLNQQGSYKGNCQFRGPHDLQIPIDSFAMMNVSDHHQPSQFRQAHFITGILDDIRGAGHAIVFATDGEGGVFIIGAKGPNSGRIFHRHELPDWPWDADDDAILLSESLADFLFRLSTRIQKP